MGYFKVGVSSRSLIYEGDMEPAPINGPKINRWVIHLGDLRIGGFSQYVVDPRLDMGVSKNSGVSPKMDGLFHGKPYLKWDDLGGNPYFLETSISNQTVPIEQ